VLRTVSASNPGTTSAKLLELGSFSDYHVGLSDRELTPTHDTQEARGLPSRYTTQLSIGHHLLVASLIAFVLQDPPSHTKRRATRLV
jgi:hypothetical protein